MVLNEIKREALAITLLLVLAIGFGIPAFREAREDVRDDLRKNDLTNLKRSLEAYYNDFEKYPFSNKDNDPCTQSNDLNSWLFSGDSLLLLGQYIDAIPHDVRESSGFVYRYCVTSYRDQPGRGFFLEAQLEDNPPVGLYFDEDERRKFDYRILTEDGKTLYQVCGGTELQCKKASKQE